jgi:hypothetical protein
MNMAGMERTFAGEIQNVEIRINGICRACLRTDKDTKK